MNEKNGKSQSEDLFREFLSRRESGEEVRPEEYFTKYPKLEGELRALFSKLNSGEAEEIDLLSESKEDSAPKTPQVIGDFRIIKEIGRGGMGTVYEVEQVSLKRKVALKLLPPHLSFSDDAVQKFRREAEAGGRQSHPGIVAIHAVGEHEGVHFIAQELVEGGRTLADQLEEIRSSGNQPTGYFREVAQLIAEIADSLQHAHDAGVIHRDIKPSNILLTSDGTPKITDFGLAKIEDALQLSRSGDFAGTPYYMSPEQAMSRRMGIDSRTDIFSLGVTLYEMLTLEHPFSGETSHEVLKSIMLVDPDDPHRTNAQVPRDLSTICLKAMEKLPDKRYQSMREFADDLRRFLSGDVILARPASFRTRAWKKIKRNPVKSVAISIVLVAATVFAVVVPWIIAAQKEAANIEIEKERDRAITAEKEAIAAKEEAQTQQIIADTALDFIVGLFESPDPKKARGFPVSLGDILDRGAEDVSDKFKEQPLIRARLFHTLGRVYYFLGDFEKAEPLLEEEVKILSGELGNDHTNTLTASSNLANLYYAQGRLEEAESIYVETIERQRRVKGDNHPSTLGSLHNLAMLYIDLSRFDEAVQFTQEVIEKRKASLGENHVDTVASLHNLAILYMNQGRDEEAEQLLLEVTEKQRDIIGSDHPDTLNSMVNLATNYKRRKQYEKAESIFQEVIENQIQILGNNHPSTLGSVTNLAILYLDTGQFEKAEKLFTDCLESYRRVLGKDHPDTIRAIMNLARVLESQRSYGEAEALYADCISRSKRVLGDAHLTTRTCMYYLAKIFEVQRRYEDAEALVSEILNIVPKETKDYEEYRNILTRLRKAQEAKEGSH